MCGRYTLSASPKLVAAVFAVPEIPDLPPRYNVAPSQSVAVVRAGGEGRLLSLFRWGLIPPWADDPRIGYRLINARAETVATKPSFRAAFKKRRCLIVADGFYEWMFAGTKTKKPYHFRMRDLAPFALAGLWEEWHSPEGEVIESCCVITTTANAVLAPVHDRMPVILPPESYARWLDPAYDRVEGLLPLLVPYPADAMESFPVSTTVNSPKYDGPECLEPVPA
jgi:putative SOS response-associated peptidase YedK